MSGCSLRILWQHNEMMDSHLAQSQWCPTGFGSAERVAENGICILCVDYMQGMSWRMNCSWLFTPAGCFSECFVPHNIKRTELGQWWRHKENINTSTQDTLMASGRWTQLSVKWCGSLQNNHIFEESTEWVRSSWAFRQFFIYSSKILTRFKACNNKWDVESQHSSCCAVALWYHHKVWCNPSAECQGFRPPTDSCCCWTLFKYKHCF